VSWILFEQFCAFLHLALYLYVITIRSWCGGVDRRPGDQKPPEDQEDYEDLLGSRPFEIEYLLGIAC
jgi:hypothetical protein